MCFCVCLWLLRFWVPKGTPKGGNYYFSRDRFKNWLHRHKAPKVIQNPAPELPKPPKWSPRPPKWVRDPKMEVKGTQRTVPLRKNTWSLEANSPVDKGTVAARHATSLIKISIYSLSVKLLRSTSFKRLFPVTSEVDIETALLKTGLGASTKRLSNPINCGQRNCGQIKIQLRSNQLQSNQLRSNSTGQSHRSLRLEES